MSADDANDSFSTLPPEIKVSSMRLMTKHFALGCFFKIVLFFFIITAIFFALDWGVAGYIFGFLAVVLFVALSLLTKRIAFIFNNGLLVPGIVVEEGPLVLAVLANMDTAMEDEPVWAIKRLELSNLPCAEGVIGEVIPCVAGFQGEGLVAWDDFDADPLSFATANIEDLKKNVARIDKEEIEILQKYIEEKKIPTEEEPLLWPEAKPE